MLITPHFPCVVFFDSVAYGRIGFAFVAAVPVAGVTIRMIPCPNQIFNPWGLDAPLMGWICILGLEALLSSFSNVIGAPPAVVA